MADTAGQDALTPRSISQHALPKKLRDSCSRCAASKVKCSRDKPKCARCTRRGETCEYTASKRTGRTSSIRVPPTSSGPMESSNTSTNVQQVTQAWPSDPRTSIPTPPPTLSDTIQANPAADIWQTILSPGSSTAQSLSPLFPIDANLDDIFASAFTSPVFDKNEGHLGNPDVSVSMDLLSDLPAPNTVQNTDQDFSMMELSGFDSFQTPERNSSAKACLITVSETLTQLSPNASASCTMHGCHAAPRKVPTITSVIQENKQVIDATCRMLECPCSRDGQMLVMISLIVFKVIAWYGAAVGESPASDHVMEWDNSANDQNSSERSRDAARRVVAELHRVLRLVRKLEEHLDEFLYRDGRSPASSDSKDAMSVDAPTHPFSLSTPTILQLRKNLRQCFNALSTVSRGILRRE